MTSSMVALATPHTIKIGIESQNTNIVIDFKLGWKTGLGLPPNERNLTQDTPDDFYWCEHYVKSHASLKHVTGGV